MREQSLGVVEIPSVRLLAGWFVLSHRTARVGVADDAISHRLGKGDRHAGGVGVA